MDNLIPTKTIKENGVIAIKNGIKPNSNKLIPIERKPTWLRVKSQNSSKYRELKEIVANKKPLIMRVKDKSPKAGPYDARLATTRLRHMWSTSC